MNNFKDNLDAIQAAVFAELKPLGFKKKARTFNRTANAWIVHVVNFQMGQYSRPSLYGKFTINIGVVLPCVSEIERPGKTDGIMQEYDCHIRSRLTDLAIGQDIWFELDDNLRPPDQVAQVIAMMNSFALPFLAKFSNYQSILDYYEAHGLLPFSNAGRSALMTAIVARHLGDIETSNRLFMKTMDTANAGFSAHVRAIAIRVGAPVA